MSRKRRRSDEELEENPPKKMREIFWKVPKSVDLQTDRCASLLNSLKKCKGSDGNDGSGSGDFLMRVPSRRVCPSYYDIVTHPIDLMKIQHKVVTDEYDSITDFLEDVQLLLNNSRLFYSTSSDEYQQVDALEVDYTRVLLSEHGIGVSSGGRSRSSSDSVRSPTHLTLRIPKSHFKFTPPASTPPARRTNSTSESVPKGESSSVKQERKGGKKSAGGVAGGRGKPTRVQGLVQEFSCSDDPVKIFLAAVFNYHDPGSREYVAEPFVHLPPRALYPEYYKVITQPIDLTTICKNTEAGKYPNLKAIQDDMITMVKNAHHFNEPGSDIYKLASALRKFIIVRCNELERKYQTVPKIMPKATPKDSPGGKVEGKKIPKLRISVSEAATRGQRTSLSSMSDSNDVQIDSSDEDWSSDEEGGERGETQQGKLLLRIKKDKLGSSSSSQDVAPKDYLTKLLQAKKPPSLKKQLMAVYRRLVSKTDDQGRVLSDLFMRRPSSKLYPEYYLVIKEPIDLREILGKVRTGGFPGGLKEMEAALDLMVNNAITFNEEDSQVYRDALTLRDIAKTTIAQLQTTAWPATPPVPATPTIQPPQRGRPRKVVPGMPGGTLPPSDVMALFKAVRTHVDQRGRHVWNTFRKLPTGVSSDYYSVVKKPIDMAIVENKMVSGLYQKLDQIFDDLSLMMDNAFTFFPRESQQSCDAIALQRTINRKYLELKADSAQGGAGKVPCVKDEVEALLRDILSHALSSKKSVSCLRGVVATRQLQLQDEGGFVAKHSFSLDNIEVWSAEGKYRRLDLLQTDILAICKQASREGKREAAEEVGRSFVAARDKVCGDGRGQLWSPALTYDLQTLESDLEEASYSRSITSSPSVGGSPDNSTWSHSHTTSPSPKPVPAEDKMEWDVPGERFEESNVCEWNGEGYAVGEVVYVQPSNPKTPRKPHIVMIEKFWKDSTNSTCFDGTWFYRPEETFHHATRKFYEKEVFRSDFHGVARIAQVVGKCCVVFSRDFPKLFPQGFDEEDVFVCESRYSYKTRSFKKIKNWTHLGVPPTLVPRDTPLTTINRVPSIFAKTSRKPTPIRVKTTPLREAGEEESKMVGPLDVPYVGLNLKSVETTVPNPDTSSVFYEQYCIDEDYFRLGDYVYLRSDQEYPFIARIDKMWTDKNGDPWIHGPWFLRPKEVSHTPTRTFYRQELLLSNIQDSNPMRSISGKCVVLPLQDYSRKRPTGYEEEDVFVLQSRYNEADKEIKRIKGLRHPQLTPGVTVVDEIFHFTHDIQLTKVASPFLFNKEFNPIEPPPQLPQIASQPVNAGGSPLFLGGKSEGSISGDTLSLGAKTGINVTPQLIQQLLASASKLPTTRPVIIPLPTSLSASATATPTTPLPSPSVGSQLPVKPTPQAVQATPIPTGGSQQFPCQWGACTQVYQGPVELYNHVVGPSISSHLAKEVEGSYFCRWKNCPRNPRSGGRPFDSMNKIMRHMREVHLMKLSTLFGIGSRVPPRPAPTLTPPLAPFRNITQTTPPPPAPAPVPPQPPVSTPPTVTKPATPPKTTASIFLPPPENKQTITHSNIYLRYIQGVKANSRYLSANADSAVLRSSHTPEPANKAEDWFSPKAIETLGGGAKLNSAAVTDALWALRDHMIKDSTKIRKYMDNFS